MLDRGYRMIVYTRHEGWPHEPAFTIQPRTVWERLFTFRPWRPFAKRKIVYKAIAYHMSDGTVLYRVKDPVILGRSL